MVDRHTEYLAVPLDHGVQVGRDQPVMLKLWMDNDFGIHLILLSAGRPVDRDRPSASLAAS
jgi:hypothetical protein